MQTFLPYTSFRRTARALDDKRLGKQRVEVLQILNALQGWTAGWVTHPVVCMWRGYEDALVLYGLVITREWKRRGKNDTVEDKLLAFVPPGWVRPRRMPAWLGDEALHRSHRAALVRKDPGHYGAAFPDVDPDEPYHWPAGAQPPDPEETMPEGHSLHRLAGQLSEAFVGQPVAVSSPQGRFAEGAAALDGHVVRAAEAVGKHLFVSFDGDALLHVHLGKQGTVLWHEPPIPAPVPPVRLRLATPTRAMDLIAPRTCALVTADEREAVLNGLGVDPLAPDASVDPIRRALHGRRTPIGAVLLDQSVFAGVGNVFRAEALHEAGLHPETPAGSLLHADIVRLWDALVPMMREAVDRGSIRPDGRAVYKQERCARCGTPVEVAEIGGRTSYACPRCQPRVGAAARAPETV